MALLSIPDQGVQITGYSEIKDFLNQRGIFFDQWSCEIESIGDRLIALNERYIEKAMLTLNPFIDRLIEDYLEFRNRRHINPTSAGTEENLLAEIKSHNARHEALTEKPPTILCCIKEIEDMRSDVYPSQNASAQHNPV